MDAVIFTVGQNRYRIQISESCAVYSVSLVREALVEQSHSLLPIFTVGENDHVWETTVHESAGIRHFDKLILYLRRYAAQFDVRYPSSLVLSHKAALRFIKREDKRPARLRARSGDSYPGTGDGRQDPAVLFDEGPAKTGA